MKPSQASDDVLVFDTPGEWRYELRIMARRDVNGDGVDDLEVCFIDRASNGGSYHTSQALLVTRYSEAGYAIALNYSLNNDECPDYAR